MERNKKKEKKRNGKGRGSRQVENENNYGFKLKKKKPKTLFKNWKENIKENNERGGKYRENVSVIKPRENDKRQEKKQKNQENKT